MTEAPVQDIDNAKVTEFLSFPPERQLSILKKMPPELKDKFKAAVTSRKDILAKQATKYPTKAEGGNPGGATAGSIARETAIGALEPFTLENLSGMVKQGGSVVSDLLTGQGFRGIKTANEMAKGILEAPIKPVGEIYSGLKEGDYNRVAHGAGGAISQTVPAVAGMAEAAGVEVPTIADLRETASKLNIPEKLQARANVNRLPVPSADLPTWGKRAAVYAAGEAFGVPHLAEAAIGLDFARRWQPYRNLKAAALEKAGQVLDIRKSPIGGNSSIPEPEATPIETVAARRSSTSADAAEEAARIRSIPPLPREPLAETPIKTEYKPPPGADDYPGKGTDPNDPGWLQGVDTKPPAAPSEPIPFTGEVATSDTAPNWKKIEDALAPSGNAAKRASQTMDAQGNPTPFGKKLVAIVPEIAKATKATAPEALMTGYGRVTQALNEIENQVPEGTTVDTVPITGSLFELSQEYMDRGLPDEAKKIDKIREQWTENKVPWGEFLARKRSFFQNHNLRSAPMKRAYGILMEASSRVSPELSEANANYSTVRRALDNANVDVNTGRRISEVGKAPSKASSVPMSERGTPPKSKPAVPKEPAAPVKTPAEARELLHEPQPAMLGENTEEAMTKAAAGRRPELLKEGQEFDQTRLVESPLFQGRGGPQRFLGTDDRAEEPVSTPKTPRSASENAAVGHAIANPEELEQLAVGDMKQFAKSVDDVRTGIRAGEGRMSQTEAQKLNVYGKETEEIADKESSRVGRSLGVKEGSPLSKFEESPKQLKAAIDKGSGKLYERIKKAFIDATIVERQSFFRSKQGTSFSGPMARQLSLEEIRKRFPRP